MGSLQVYQIWRRSEKNSNFEGEKTECTTHEIWIFAICSIFVGLPRPHTPQDRGFLYNLYICTKFLTIVENLAGLALPVPEILAPISGLFAKWRNWFSLFVPFSWASPAHIPRNIGELFTISKSTPGVYWLPSFHHSRDIGFYIWPVREKSKHAVKISKSQHRKNPREFFSRRDFANFVVSNKVDDEEFESVEKTGNGSSFIRHFDEKSSKTAENRQKSDRVARIWGPSNSGASAMHPSRRSDSEYAECAFVGCAIRNRPSRN